MSKLVIKMPTRGRPRKAPVRRKTGGNLPKAGMIIPIKKRNGQVGKGILVDLAKWGSPKVSKELSTVAGGYNPALGAVVQAGSPLINEGLLRTAWAVENLFRKKGRKKAFPGAKKIMSGNYKGNGMKMDGKKNPKRSPALRRSGNGINLARPN